MAFQQVRLIRRPERVSGSGTPPTRQYRYRVAGTNVPTYALNLVKADAPNVIATPQGILYRREPTYDQTAYDRFDLEVEYSSRKDEPGTWDWDADTTGETVNVMVSKETIRRYGVNLATGSQYASEAGSAASSNIPKYNGAIGVEADGQTIKGTTQVIPAMRFNVTYKYPPGIVVPAHAKFIHGITGKVDSTGFLDWASGEVLFMGGRLRSGDHVESSANFSFAMSPNATGLSFGQVAGVDKDGWEYVWIKYAWGISSGRLIRQPQFVYRERIYDEVDLAALLGIYN